MKARGAYMSIMSSLDNVDEVQSHILGVITSLMTSYALDPTQVSKRYDYVRALPAKEIAHLNSLTYLEYKNNSDSDSSDMNIDANGNESPDDVGGYNTAVSSKSSSWADLCYESDQSMESNNDKIFVSTRREFRNTMTKGIKICPKYSTCENVDCKNFHILPHHLCPHDTRGSYCENNQCDKIVIRACRKGKRCNDSNCSFRHR